MTVRIRVLGCGNAWPVELGCPSTPRALELIPHLHLHANTAYAIESIREGTGDTEWLVVIDMGLGIVSALAQCGNRLPDAVVLTHPHFDHVAGLDALVASQGRHGAGKLVVHATTPCWTAVRTMFPWLRAGVDHRPIPLGIDVEITSTLTIQALPVYHGPFAPGACMILAKIAGGDAATPTTRVLFTGDLLTPLLRDRDIEELRDVSLVLSDANTRYPWPQSGHWSVTRDAYGNALETWNKCDDLRTLCAPHVEDPTAAAFFHGDALHRFWTIDEFAQAIRPETVACLHYSGFEDQEHHGQPILTSHDLADWLGGLGSNWQWVVPKSREWTIVGSGQPFRT